MAGVWSTEITRYRHSAVHHAALVASATALDPVNQGGDLVVHLTAFFHQTGDLFHGVNDRRVVTAAELSGDGRVAEIGQIPENVHAYLAGIDERPAPARDRKSTRLNSSHSQISY